MADGHRWPRIVVVTDRRRLVRHVEADLDAWPDLLLAQVAGALAGGADLVQVREPDLEAGVLTRFLRRLFDRVGGSAARVVVNDRMDVAWVTGAAGVHLPERAVSVEDARRLLPPDRPWVIGRSVHTAAQAATAGRASYLLAGTVLPSGSKPAGWTVLGWEGLAAIVQAAGGTPVVAIGGLGGEHAGAAIAAGAAGLAGIGCFLPASRVQVEMSVQERVLAVRKAFDTTGGDTYTRSAGT